MSMDSMAGVRSFSSECNSKSIEIIGIFMYMCKAHTYGEKREMFLHHLKNES